MLSRKKVIKPKKVILIIVGLAILILLVASSVFWWKSGDLDKSQSSDINPNDSSNQETPPLPENNDKTELKIFWVGSLSFANDDWKDYWVFSEAKEGEWMYPTNKRFLLPKNTPILVDKDLWQQDLLFNLVYSKNQGSKVEKADKNGNPNLTMIKNNFTLIPLSPIKNDSDFLNRWENTKAKEIYFDYSQYSGGDYIFIDNQIQGGKPEKDLDKYVFHPDNPSIKELLAKKHLQVQNRRSDKEYQIFYLERDIEKRVSAGNSTTYYFNNEAKVKTATLRP
ncbi:exported protein of unknown function [endosymbiont DhMRE of Dentiscutata heterogama]|uniref:hypothetical protein n=1 Tax=endosymbiont DhMRE of Dentiscutata heterogama TaxID=1609546 RepID=UPI000629D807|nr:hypothetical protein [endosymbiont DhMRE of Dentiscutata heterogama]CFW93439.1 exported protein of unknown function [endosymbiont DhMRE of Dentiscutata heterogama]